MEEQYTFHHLDRAVFSTFDSKESQAKFRKWGMSQSMSLQKFRFDIPFNEFHPERFLLDLVNSPVISSVLPHLGASRKRNPVLQLSFKEVPSIQTSMEIFNVLKEKDLVYENGAIRKVVPEYVDDIEICDKIREVLLFEESEDFGAIGEEVRNEFLFKIFEHFLIGGGMCQYEDEIAEYLDLVKGVYKDLVAVSKDQESAELKVTSKVFQVLNSADFEPFRNKHLQDFFYVVVDPGYRHVNIWTHKWTGMW
jgi:hypothetical protein